MGTTDPISNSRPVFRAASDDGLGAVVGYPAVAQRLRSIVVQPVSAAWAGLPDVVAPTGVLLYGPPGGAAGVLRLAVERELGVGHAVFDARSGGEIATGERCVVHLDGLDDVHRVAGGPGRSVDELFGHLADLSPAVRPLVIATSVAPWHLDPALFTVGRLDRLVFVPPPSWEARTVALHGSITELDLEVAARISLLAAATVGWSGADLEELVEQLSAESSTDPSDEIGQSSQLLDAVSRIVPRTKSWVGRAREMVDVRAHDGMMDDLVTWLRRVG